MERKGTSVRTKVALITILSVAVLLSGCSSPFGLDPDSEGAQSNGGNLVISVGSGSGNVSTMTVFPTFELSLIGSYKITLTDPAGSRDDVVSIEDTADGSFPSPLELRDIIPGTWNVKVEAYDGPKPASANLLLSGTQQSVKITAGQTSSVSSITLSSIECDSVDCEGTLDLTVSWPDDQGVDEVYYEVKPFDGDETLEHDATVTSVDFDGPDGENRYSVSFPDSGNNTLPAGLYWVTVRFDDNTDDGTSAWVVDELVYIRANLTSTHEFKLDYVPLEQQIEEEITESVDDAIADPDNDGFTTDEEFGYAYTGNGGGTLTIDTSEIDDDAIVSFKVRSEATGEKFLDGDSIEARAEARFDIETQVKASLYVLNEEGEEELYEPPADNPYDYEENNPYYYYPPGPYIDDYYTDEEPQELLPPDDTDVLSLQDLDNVSVNSEWNPAPVSTVLTTGDYAGFLEGEFFLDETVDEILFEFGGGSKRKYTFGDFTVSLP